MLERSPIEDLLIEVLVRHHLAEYSQQPTPHIDVVLASGCDDLATVKLQTGDGVLVANRVRDSPSP